MSLGGVSAGGGLGIEHQEGEDVAEGAGESRGFFLCSFVVVCLFVNILIEASGDPWVPGGNDGEDECCCTAVRGRSEEGLGGWPLWLTQRPAPCLGVPPSHSRAAHWTSGNTERWLLALCQDQAATQVPGRERAASRQRGLFRRWPGGT